MNRLLYETAMDWVFEGARVLDLGCGDGLFLSQLFEKRRISGEGVERDSAMVMLSIERGLDVHHGDLLDGLAQHPDQSFDFVMLLGTFQELIAPEAVLAESFRVGRQVILAHSNFANFRYRWHLSWQGRSPKTDDEDRPWYRSPTTQLFSVEDFIKYCNRRGVHRKQAAFFGRKRRLRFWPNLFAREALWLLEARASSFTKHEKAGNAARG
ncbi:MAG: methyltransferase domain-containing protein [Leptospiraceae bacterium]|nr:methyltransferase domain-containing protein [Leptospiraceae bacterium]